MRGSRSSALSCSTIGKCQLTRTTRIPLFCFAQAGTILRGRGAFAPELQAFDAVAYFDAGMDRKDPRASPLYADLRSFPPILIQVGSAEVLLEDATRFAAVAGAAGVAVTLEIWPHMIHAWPLWNARLEPGRRALVSAGAFIQRHL